MMMSDADLAKVERALGDRVICQACGATWATYNAETCTADLDDWCDGFEAVEAALGDRSFRNRTERQRATTDAGKSPRDAIIPSPSQLHKETSR